MAGQDELIYKVVAVPDEQSFKAVADQLTALQQQAKVQPNGGKGGAPAVKELAEAEAKLRTEIQARNKATLESVKNQKLLDDAGKLSGKTYNELVQINKALAVQLKGLDFKTNADEIRKLQAQYANNNQALKDFDKAMGNNQRSVGDYKESIKDALKELGGFGGAIVNVTGQFNKQKDAIKSADPNIKGFKANFQALNATMKANVFIAVFMAVKSLIEGLSGLEFISKKVAAVTATLSGAWQGFLKAISTGDWSASMKEQIALSQEIQQAQKALYEVETENLKVRAASAEIIEREKFNAKDQTKTIEERIQALKIAQREQDALTTREIEIARESARIAKLKNEQATKNADTRREEAEAIARLSELEAQNFNRQKENLEQLSTLRAQQREQIKQTGLLSVQVYEEEGRIIKSNTELAKLSKSALIELEKIQLQNTLDVAKKQRDIERQNIQESIADEKLKTQQLALVNQQYFNTTSQAYAAYEDNVTRIAFEAAQQRIAIANLTASSIADIGEGLNALGLISAKRAFQIQKASDVSQAITSGIVAVQKALASAPPPFNFGIAAIVGAATAGNVAKILATKFGDTSAGGSQSPRGSGLPAASAPSGPAAGISIQPITSQIASQAAATASAGAQKPVFVVQNNIDRAGMATLVKEGNDELSARGLAVSSV